MGGSTVIRRSNSADPRILLIPYIVRASLRQLPVHLCDRVLYCWFYYIDTIPKNSTQTVGERQDVSRSIPRHMSSILRHASSFAWPRLDPHLSPRINQILSMSLTPLYPSPSILGCLSRAISYHRLLLTHDMKRQAPRAHVTFEETRSMSFVRCHCTYTKFFIVWRS
jgi:hypothetical protein